RGPAGANLGPPRGKPLRTHQHHPATTPRKARGPALTRGKPENPSPPTRGEPAGKPAARIRPHPRRTSKETRTSTPPRQVLKSHRPPSIYPPARNRGHPLVTR